MNSKRRTKIVCTIGPASEVPEVVQKLLRAGMNVARLNFSHGTHEEHGNRIKVLKEQASLNGKHLAILLDTKGPEIRTGKVPDDGVELVRETTFILDTEPENLGSAERVGVTYSNLCREVHKGVHILLDDGLIDLEVMEIQDGKIITKVINGGLLKSKKGVNVPGISIQLPAITDKDREDIIFGISQGVDFIAASFTRKASDVIEIRRILEEYKANIKVIAKIENREGLENLDSILEVSDGLMIARGDLGVEIPVEEVPICQKEMIQKCHQLGKPVIVATQMLDSMIRQPRPTRAEASDVANAIFDGTDAIMLSGETAAGQYPVQAVEMMNKIALQTESHYLREISLSFSHANITDAISHASYTIARDLDAKAILTPTQSGLTARMISKYRPKSLVIAATPYAQVARQLSIQWGIYPIVVPESSGTDQLLSLAVNEALNQNYVQTGDVVVITAGVPVGKVGTTNLIKVQVVGNVLAKGMGIGRKSYTGPARIVTSEEDSFEPGDILVASFTDKEFVPFISKAGAMVVEKGGLTSHAAITALSYGIPAIVGAENILKYITNGEIITVDALAGVVYEGAVSIL